MAIMNRRMPHIAALVLVSDLFLLVSFTKPSCKAFMIFLS